jgi:hypothetical protein
MPRPCAAPTAEGSRRRGGRIGERRLSSERRQGNRRLILASRPNAIVSERARSADGIVCSVVGLTCA